MMKSALILAFTLVSVVCYGQPTNEKITSNPCDKTECRNRPYMYKFCDPTNGYVIDKCSADPNNEPGLRLLKKMIPLTLCPDFQGQQFNRVWSDSSNPLEEHRIDIFVNENMYKVLNDAEAAWTSMCPPQGPDEEYQPCCLPVVWSQSPADMGNQEYSAAITRMRVLYSDPLAEHNCDIDCFKSRIVINQESAYLDLDDRGRPRRFLFTERESVDSIPREWVYFDAQGVLLHELGHWLGFGHSDAVDRFGNSCMVQNSAMLSGEGNEAFWNRRIVEPSWDDVCMFKKAYCCAQTKADIEETVAETGNGLSFSLAPNPATSELRMKFSMPISARGATLRLVNAIGEIALEQRIEKETQEIALSVASVPNGWYLVEVVAGDVTFAKKVLIED